VSPEVLAEVARAVQEICSRLGVPPPRVEVVRSGQPYYLGGTIYLPEDLPPEMVERVVAHEVAHHLHELFGVPVSTPEAEAFARTFEEVWIRMRKGYKYPVLVCSRCGFRMFAYGGRVECPKCGTVYTYSRKLGYPDPESVLGALGLGAVAAIAAYAVTSYARRSPKVRELLRKELSPEEAAAVGAGIVGALVALLLR